MENLWLTATSKRYVKRIQTEFRVKAVGGLPAKHNPGEEIHDRHPVVEAILKRDVGQGRLNVSLIPLRRLDHAPAKHRVDVVGHGHQSSPDGTEAIRPQQVKAQCEQGRHNLNAAAFGVAAGVLAKLPITDPVPLVLDCPSLPYKVQQALWAGSHRRDDLVDVAEWLAVTLA
jgi:hypothetical protein